MLHFILHHKTLQTKATQIKRTHSWCIVIGSLACSTTKRIWPSCNIDSVALTLTLEVLACVSRFQGSLVGHPSFLVILTLGRKASARVDISRNTIMLHETCFKNRYYILHAIFWKAARDRIQTCRTKFSCYDTIK